MLSALLRFAQSQPVTDHCTGTYPSARTARRVPGRRRPQGQRMSDAPSTVEYSMPAASLAVWQRRSSSFTRSVEHSASVGWVKVWLPTAWPASLTSRASAGSRSTHFPI